MSKMMSEFSRGDVVRWSSEYLERGRKIDLRWYEEQKDSIGTVDRVQRDGDVVVDWVGCDASCVHPAGRLAKVHAEVPL